MNPIHALCRRRNNTNPIKFNVVTAWHPRVGWSILPSHINRQDRERTLPGIHTTTSTRRRFPAPDIRYLTEKRRLNPQTAAKPSNSPTRYPPQASPTCIRSPTAQATSRPTDDFFLFLKIECSDGEKRQLKAKPDERHFALWKNPWLPPNLDTCGMPNSGKSIDRPKKKAESNSISNVKRFLHPMCHCHIGPTSHILASRAFISG